MFAKSLLFKTFSEITFINTIAFLSIYSKTSMAYLANLVFEISLETTFAPIIIFSFTSFIFQ